MLSLILSSLVLVVLTKVILDVVGGEVEDEGRITRRRKVR